MEVIASAGMRRVRDEVDGDKLNGPRGSDTLEAHEAVPGLRQPNRPALQPVLQARLLCFEEVPALLHTRKACKGDICSPPELSNTTFPNRCLNMASFLHADIRFRTILPSIGPRLAGASHRIETDDVDAARTEHQQRQVVRNAPCVVLRKPSSKRHPLTVRVIDLVGLVRPWKEESARRPVLTGSVAARVCAVF